MPKTMNLKERLEILVRGRLASWRESESSIAVGRGWLESRRDRPEYDRAGLLQDALDAWRLNPLARRIVELTTQYVVGSGIKIRCPNERNHRFIQDFWNHPLNHLDVRCYELCDELTRSGNLFILLSTDPGGMSYIRCLPAADILQIDSRPNDIEQPLSFTVRGGAGPLGDRVYPAYHEEEDEVGADGSFRECILHYTVNRPVGGQWGESDLAPELKWMARYTAWLEDRARLNRFRNAFMYMVKGRFLNEEDRQTRQATLAANPPGPGSILVCDESESWEILSPKLEAGDAASDGLALKKMIAAGAGLPMHFLAEPESSTRTTAEAAGGPTYRRFEQRQKYFLWILGDMVRVAVQRRALVDKHVSRKAAVEIQGSDISSRDNVALAMAASNITSVLDKLRDRGLIDSAEYLRLVYRFCGETVDIEEMLGRARQEGPALPAASPVHPTGRTSDLDPDSGELKPGVEQPAG